MSATPQPDALSSPRHRHVELPHKTVDTVPLKRGFSQISQDNQVSEKEEDGLKHGIKSLRTTLGNSEQIAPFGISQMSHHALEALEAFEEHLSCDMCAGILLKPVALDGCGHIYCGSCVRQWIQTTRLQKFKDELDWTCPACRHGPLTKARPSALVRKLCDVLVQYRPQLARCSVEAARAAAMYSGADIDFPTSDEGNFDEFFWQPCKWCYERSRGFQCPIPIPGGEERIQVDDPIPDGHFNCDCGQIGPIDGPATFRCDMCTELRCCTDDETCVCVPAKDARPLYERREPVYQYARHIWKNEIEGEHANLVFDVLHEADNLDVIYREIYDWATSPEGRAAGGFAAVIAPLHRSVSVGLVKDFKMIKDDGQEAKICNDCCESVINAGLFGWLQRTLDKLEGDLHPELAEIKARPRCKFGLTCTQQYNCISHREEFSHLHVATEQEVVNSDEKVVASDKTTPEASLSHHSIAAA